MTGVSNQNLPLSGLDLQLRMHLQRPDRQAQQAFNAWAFHLLHDCCGKQVRAPHLKWRAQTMGLMASGGAVPRARVDLASLPGADSQSKHSLQASCIGSSTEERTRN
jgi:hypothetical protein